MDNTAPLSTQTVKDQNRNPLVADVPPHDYGTAEWHEDASPFLSLQRKRFPDRTDAEHRDAASLMLRKIVDGNDLRALGYCRDCRRAGELQQVGRCVYWSTCNCYRVQGDLRRMKEFQAEALARMTPERKASLLTLIGISEVSHG